MDKSDRAAAETCDSERPGGRQRTAANSRMRLTSPSFQHRDRPCAFVDRPEPQRAPQVNVSLPAPAGPPILRVALLTGGDDKSYALGLTSALVAHRVSIDFIGSDKLDAPELHATPLVKFLNLRGDQRENVSFLRKVLRILAYHWRLVRYAAAAQPPVFHILWNNKFQLVDRVLLMLYYRLLGKKIVLTAHNVNAAKRDSKDTIVNRATLRVQYHLAHHIFVHTERMQGELVAEFAISKSKTSVIPFGINNTSPTTAITSPQAKQRLGVSTSDKTMLFFGQIAPYKGLEYLVDAFSDLVKRNDGYRLIIAGKVKKGARDYWDEVRRKIANRGARQKIIERIEYIPDEEIELYFKAADVLIVPYVQIFQSGLPFLAYSFGLPVIATDVASLRKDIIEGRTGFLCRPQDSSHLASTIDHYFKSELFHNLEARREEIKKFANERYSWDKVAAIITAVYRDLLTRATNDTAKLPA
jgi:D-inositol-3-phosphate glycosyltransferase